jgi:hypothetical protein
MQVKITKVASGTKYPYGFYATGESLAEFGKKQKTETDGPDYKGDPPSPDVRHHQM